MITQSLFTSQDLPEYHDHLLIVKLRQTAGPLASMGAAMGAAADVMQPLLASPGIAALSLFQRAGMIKRVTPLGRHVDWSEPLLGLSNAVAAMAHTVVPPLIEDTHLAGVSLVQLERPNDVPDLQLALARDPHVEFVSRVPVRYVAMQTPSGKQAVPPGATIAATPPPPSAMWNLRKIRWEEARARPEFKEPTNIRVAVLDTGADANHPDLAGRIDRYVYTHPDLPINSSNQDIAGHGTHVLGTIGASANKGLGINGVCNCRLLAWKIFDDEPRLVGNPFVGYKFVYLVRHEMYLRALTECLDEGVEVINLSIAGTGNPEPLELSLLQMLLANGTTVVAAMGNSRQAGSPISYPAAIPGVIAVGATNLNDAVAEFSNRGNHISLCAPGKAIWSTLPTYAGQTAFEAASGPNGDYMPGRPLSRGTYYDAWQGTSMAAPHVAAAAAMLLAERGEMDSSAVRNQLASTADRVPGMADGDFDPDYGAGRLNLLRLLST